MICHVCLSLSLSASSSLTHISRGQADETIHRMKTKKPIPERSGNHPIRLQGPLGVSFLRPCCGRVWRQPNAGISRNPMLCG